MFKDSIIFTIALALVVFVHNTEYLEAGDLFTEAQAQEQKFFTDQEYFNEVMKFAHPTEQAIECLALNIYHESRNEEEVGQRAVGFVVMNRVESDLFPNSVCEVVYQARLSRWHLENTGKEVPIKNQCQFSWYCDGKSDTPYEAAKFEHARELAFQIIVGYNNNKLVDITNGALWYHAYYVKPKWAKDYERVGQYDSHIFYKRPS